MEHFASKGDAAVFARGAVEHNRAAIDLCQGDGQLRAFKYLLMRLTTAGLSVEEVPNLRRVGEAVFTGADPSVAAQVVLGNSSSSPLAIEIANAALKQPDTRQRSLLGAVLAPMQALGCLSG